MAINCPNFTGDVTPPYIQNKNTGEFIHSQEELLLAHMECKATCDMIRCTTYNLFKVIVEGVESRMKRHKNNFKPFSN